MQNSFLSNDNAIYLSGLIGRNARSDMKKFIAASDDYEYAEDTLDYLNHQFAKQHRRPEGYPNAYGQKYPKYVMDTTNDFTVSQFRELDAPPLEKVFMVQRANAPKVHYNRNYGLNDFPYIEDHVSVPKKSIGLSAIKYKN